MSSMSGNLGSALGYYLGSLAKPYVEKPFRERAERDKEIETSKLRQILESDEWKKKTTIGEKAAYLSTKVNPEVAKMYVEGEKATPTSKPGIDNLAFKKVIDEADFSTKQGQKDFMSKSAELGVDPVKSAKIIQQFAPDPLENFARKYSDVKIPENTPGFEQQQTIQEPLEQIQPQAMQEQGIPYQIQPQPQIMSQPTQQSAQIPTQKQRPKIEDIPEDDIIPLMVSNNPRAQQLGKGLLDIKDSKRKEFYENRKYEAGRAKKYTDQIQVDRQANRVQKSAIDNIFWALDNKDMSFFSKDNIADILGRYGTGLVSPEGAVLSNSVKEFLMGEISRLKGRPNMFIEQRIMSMLPWFGKSQEANRSIAYALKFNTDLKSEEIRVHDELSNKFEKELGYVPGNIDKIVAKHMEPYTKNLENKLAYNLRREQEKKEGLAKLSKKGVKLGTPLTAEMGSYLKEKYPDREKFTKTVKSLGYSIPSKSLVSGLKNELQ